MFLNETKGSFGMFSRAGRHSTEKYNILMKKDEILSGKKKTKLTDMFGDTKHKEYSDDDEEIEMVKIEKEKNNTKNIYAKVGKSKRVKYKNYIRWLLINNTFQVN